MKNDLFNGWRALVRSQAALRRECIFSLWDFQWSILIPTYTLEGIYITNDKTNKMKVDHRLQERILLGTDRMEIQVGHKYRWLRWNVYQKQMNPGNRRWRFTTDLLNKNLKPQWKISSRVYQRQSLHITVTFYQMVTYPFSVMYAI